MTTGNRLSSLNLSPWTFNDSNQLLSTPATTFAYDNNGNTTGKTDTNGTTSYAWDYENRLTSVTLPGEGGVVTFKYDPFGRRVQKSGPLGTTNYLYDGWDLIEVTCPHFPHGFKYGPHSFDPPRFSGPEQTRDFGGHGPPELVFRAPNSLQRLNKESLV